MANQYLADLFGLNGKTAVLTGATRGIGQSLALALASAGADLVLLQVSHYTSLRESSLIGVPA